MELDQEVRKFFTSDEQVEAKRLSLYVSVLHVCFIQDNIVVSMTHKRRAFYLTFHYVQKNFLKCKVDACFSK